MRNLLQILTVCIIVTVPVFGNDEISYESEFDRVLDHKISVDYTDAPIKDILTELGQTYDIPMILPAEGFIKNKVDIRISDIGIRDFITLLLGMAYSEPIFESGVCISKYYDGSAYTSDDSVWGDFMSIFVFFGSLITPLLLFLTPIPNIIFACAILLEKREKYFFVRKSLWCLSTLIGGVIVAFGYWILHHTDISHRQTHEAGR